MLLAQKRRKHIKRQRQTMYVCVCVCVWPPVACEFPFDFCGGFDYETHIKEGSRAASAAAAGKEK